MSELRANTISDLAGTGPVALTKQSAAKSWINFNGTGTIVERDSFNVASLTDVTTGTYTVNLTSSMANAGHSATMSGAAGAGTGNKGPYVGSFTAGTIPLICYNTSGSLVDNSVVTVNGHGDLA